MRLTPLYLRIAQNFLFRHAKDIFLATLMTVATLFGLRFFASHVEPPFEAAYMSSLGLSFGLWSHGVAKFLNRDKALLRSLIGDTRSIVLVKNISTHIVFFLFLVVYGSFFPFDITWALAAFTITVLIFNALPIKQPECSRSRNQVSRVWKILKKSALPMPARAFFFRRHLYFKSYFIRFAVLNFLMLTSFGYLQAASANGEGHPLILLLPGLIPLMANGMTESADTTLSQACLKWEDAALWGESTYWTAFFMAWLTPNIFLFYLFSSWPIFWGILVWILALAASVFVNITTILVKIRFSEKKFLQNYMIGLSIAIPVLPILIYRDIKKRRSNAPG